MNLRKNLLGIAAFGALSACQGANGVFLFDDTVFSDYFVKSFAPYEAAASVLRASPKYVVQEIAYWQHDIGYPWYKGNSFKSVGVEYAHAAGLTGAGETISIVDTGFRLTHEMFSGKQIWYLGAFSVDHFDNTDDHGTHVASIAAGVNGSGQMIGVAPGANLLLGLYDTDASVTAANNHAIQRGAIVQNNSWGLVDSVTGIPISSEHH